MTERDRIDAAALILAKYGIAVSPDNEILPLIVSITDLEKNCLLSIAEAVNKISAQQKIYQIKTPAQAFFLGFGKWGLPLVIAATGFILLVTTKVLHSKAQETYIKVRAQTEEMQNKLQKANDLGYLKDIPILEDEKGKYILLENTGSNHAEAGKNFELLKEGENHYVAKVYTLYYK